MADAPPFVHIGENSPEEVAFKLLLMVGRAEKKGLTNTSTDATRKWVLDTYAECLEAVRGARTERSIWSKLAE